MSQKLLFMLFVSVIGANAQQRTCPKCAHALNPASCTEIQNCHDNECVLHVNRVLLWVTYEFTCGNPRNCNNHGPQGCENHREGTCTHCCENVQSCLDELRLLVPELHTPEPTHKTTHAIPITNAADTSNVPITTYFPGTTTAPVTTNIPVITNIPMTTNDLTTSSAPMNTNSVMTTDASATYSTWSATSLNTLDYTGFTGVENGTFSWGTPSANTGVSGTLTPPTSDSTTPEAAHSCVQCGNFASDKFCTSMQVLLNRPTPCLDGFPYCYETVNVVAGNVQVSRGCAEPNFCRAEWDQGHARQGCFPLDLTSDNATCTYCCKGILCNTVTPPENANQVSFT